MNRSLAFVFILAIAISNLTPSQVQAQAAASASTGGAASGAAASTGGAAAGAAASTGGAAGASASTGAAGASASTNGGAIASSGIGSSASSSTSNGVGSQASSTQITANSYSTATAQTCDLIAGFLYQNNCIPKSCLINKLSKITLTPLDQYTTNIGKLRLGIVYTTTVIQSASGFMYHVQILYGDDANNQIVSDPVNCVDWRIYQTANSFDVDNTRLYSPSQGAIPAWPASQYVFNAQASAGQIDFSLSQSDLSARGCIKFTSQTQISWECFFEMAFIVKGITQASYYFSIRILIDTTSSTNVLPTVNFVKIVQVDRCPVNADPNSSQCQVEISIASSLLFCPDSSCQQVSIYPYFVLYLNRVFWMIHQIDNVAFRASWSITNDIISYQAYGFFITLRPSEYTVVKSTVGFNIYQLKVPIAANNVLISASGLLVQQGARLLQAGDDAASANSTNQTQNTVHAKANTGIVTATAAGASSVSTASTTAHTSSQSNQNLAQNSDTSSQDHAQNAFALSTGFALIAAIMI